MILFLFYCFLCLMVIFFIFDLYKRMKIAEKEYYEKLSKYYTSVAAKEAEDRKELERKF